MEGEGGPERGEGVRAQDWPRAGASRYGANCLLKAAQRSGVKQLKP